MFRITCSIITIIGAILQTWWMFGVGLGLLTIATIFASAKTYLDSSKKAKDE